MKKHIYIAVVACIAIIGQSVQANPIKAICFDIATIFTTNNLRASSYVGKINSLRYCSQTGHLPCQEDLFRHLALYRAISQVKTYTDNQEMPLIFSDWLSQQQSTNTLKANLIKYLEQRSISDIEKQVLCAIISMMMTPEHLVDTQKIRHKIESILQALHHKGIKLYLTGNWAHINSLKMAFPEIFRLFDGVFTSGTLKLIKPSKEYYDQIIHSLKINPESIIWIETQTRIGQVSASYKLHTITYDPDDVSALIAGLKKYHIAL